jgi:hypothetical protein
MEHNTLSTHFITLRVYMSLISYRLHCQLHGLNQTPRAGTRPDGHTDAGTGLSSLTR